MRTSIDQSWKRRAAQSVRRLTPTEAKDVLVRIAAEGYTIFHPDIKRITGGHNSQSINYHVIRLLHKRAQS